MNDLDDLCYGLPSLVLRLTQDEARQVRQWISPLNYYLHFLLANKLHNQDLRERGQSASSRARNGVKYRVEKDSDGGGNELE